MRGDSGVVVAAGGTGAAGRLGNKQSVGFLTVTLGPGASVSCTVTVKATAKGTPTIAGGVLSARTRDPQPADNLRTVRIAVT